MCNDSETDYLTPLTSLRNEELGLQKERGKRSKNKIKIKEEKRLQRKRCNIENFFVSLCSISNDFKLLNFSLAHRADRKVSLHHRNPHRTAAVAVLIAHQDIWMT